MAQPTVKTVQYIDPRIEPQPDPVYDYVIAPTQNQYYSIPASGRSNSSLNFNNLTTLGIDRAYLDTFEIELTAKITFTIQGREASNNAAAATTIGALAVTPDQWVFDSFPFNKACDEIRVNINGGAFFSQPLSYLRAKERYMKQWELSHGYQNVCPVQKPMMQNESGRNYSRGYDPDQDKALMDSNAFWSVNDHMNSGLPTRLGVYKNGSYGLGSQGLDGGWNNSFIDLGPQLTPSLVGNTYTWGYTNYKCITTYDAVHHTPTSDVVEVTVTWREPVFCSPFSSRYDATYGRPLYNITSLDFTFTMPTLKNMIRVVNRHVDNGADGYKTYISDYNIEISSANLRYQVMTIPPVLTKPLTTLVPYRRFVPYITDYNQTGQNNAGGGGGSPTVIPAIGASNVQVSSGVYTFNEIPTAIWIFMAPTKAAYQSEEPLDQFAGAGANNNVCFRGSWDSNKLFAFLDKLEISMANTTQILSTAEPYDLYRIAKANGCQDSFVSWHGGLHKLWPAGIKQEAVGGVDYQYPNKDVYGAGSVLRLKPGVDIIIPDQALVPGANGHNMVFQVRATFTVPPHAAAELRSRYALWLLFEYVGVAAISPGQCEITMNPLGTGEIMEVSPVMSATSEETTEGTVEGSGVWDTVRRRAAIAAHLANDGIINRLLKRIPGKTGEKVAAWAEEHNMAPTLKRKRAGAVTGGAVIGKGFDEWI